MPSAKLTKEQVKEEILRCGKDPAYFIRNYVKIQHPVRGLIPFKLFDYQEDLMKDYTKHRFNIVLKARQLGISETTAAFATWMIMFHRDKNILVVATKMETAKNIIRKVRVAIKRMPSWLKLTDMIADSVLSVELNNGSRIKSVASSDDVGRSEALSLLIVDEAAHIRNMAELWTGLLPTVQAGGRVIMLSTPNGVGNTFHSVYTDAESGMNDFNPTKLMWWVHPERIDGLKDDTDRPGFKTSKWFVKETRNMTRKDVGQELECDFISSGDTVVSIESLEWIESGVYDPFEKDREEFGLSFWMPPKKDTGYFITADVARGDGADYSAAILWDIKNLEQVGEYFGKVPPDRYSKILCDMGKKYNNALLVVENNAIGLACLEHIKLAGYENLYFSRKGDIANGIAMNASFTTYDDKFIAGFTTTPKNRPLMVSKFEEYVRNRLLTIRSKRLLEQLRTFMWVNGKAQGMNGYSDDLVSAAIVAIWMRDTYFFNRYSNVEGSHILLDMISCSTTTTEQVPGVTTNPDIIKKQGPSFIVNEVNKIRSDEQYKMKLPNGQIIDLSWMISSG